MLMMTDLQRCVFFVEQKFSALNQHAQRKNTSLSFVVGMGATNIVETERRGAQQLEGGSQFMKPESPAPSA